MRSASSFLHVFHLPASGADTFRLFSDPAKLDELTPRWFRLEPITEFSLPLAVGDEISYRLGLRGLPLRWRSRIVEWEPPTLLTYEQVAGPYRFFRHEHRFREVDEGTRVEDRVLFRSPGGRLAESVLVRPELRRIFQYRESAARRLLAGANKS